MRVVKYPAARQALLERIAAYLASDDRFPAAWLAGSFGRGESDGYSDLDITVAVAQACAQALCARPVMVSGGTTPERFTLFSRFGEPAVIHENHHNSPGGTFTFVLYRENAQIVDWTLLPEDLALRPPQSVLLYGRAGIPLQPPPEPEPRSQRARMASERAAFFWMIAAATARTLPRGNLGAFYELLGMLSDTLEEVKRLVSGQPRQYWRRPLLPLACTLEEQKAALRGYCNEMEGLHPDIRGIGGEVPVQPRVPIDILLDLAEDR